MKYLLLLSVIFLVSCLRFNNEYTYCNGRYYKHKHHQRIVKEYLSWKTNDLYQFSTPRNK